MQLCATLTREDLTSAIEAITPLRVVVRSGPVISLGRPANVELVAGAGLRVRGDAHFAWDVGGVTLPVTLRAWQVLFVPSFVARGGAHVLAFEPVLEALDFKGVPLFLGSRIKDVIESGLRAQKGKLAWDFGKHLSLVKSLPSAMIPTTRITLAPNGGSIVVTADEVRLTLTFGLAIERDVPTPGPHERAGNRPRHRPS